MKRAVRPLAPEDVPALLELFAAAGLQPNVEPQGLAWKYWLPRADWPGPRAFLLANGGAPIAHGALIPGWCLWQSRRISVAHLIDWAARPDATGAGARLLKHVGQQAQALLAVGGSAQTLALLPHLGFHPLGTVTGYVRTLFPLRRLRADAAPAWRRLARFTRNLTWALAAPSRHDPDWVVQRITAADVERIAVVLPRPVRGMAVLERSVALFRHVLACPIVPMALYAIERSERVRGYFLLAAAPGQVRIVDCWMDSDDPEEWRALILCAVQAARREREAAEVVGWANDAVLATALGACGFHPRHQTPVQLRAADPALLPPVPLRVQMLDNDAAFLCEPRNRYWA